LVLIQTVGLGQGLFGGFFTDPFGLPYSAPTKRWYLAGPLNATDMPAIPSKYIAAIFRSETASATRAVEPIFD